ncbi:U6 snRNA-associated Sm-like protein LSm8 [Echinococcus granulosus]|uniref:U6 snRNA-associated Sm-like protein LSm8 n=1 Tax=Echinococcus granulosus TaxID=6210 RepID=W6UBZ2_ECHGR|nr:U6 snRNA-associated Sm-like protein LSm8 [Echinococcus granulosus]EUB58655.1 U6 snRNA-associated Sm-like protein LSm8 [Echinococcus granulosus]
MLFLDFLLIHEFYSVGTLKGFDNVINLIVNDSHERVFSPDRGVECVPLGLYIIRGQNVAVVGEVDEDLDSRVDFENLRAEPLNPIIH